MARHQRIAMTLALLWNLRDVVLDVREQLEPSIRDFIYVLSRSPA
jgi:hypothetical protein